MTPATCAARCVGGNCDIRIARAGRLPLLGGAAGDAANIGCRLGRQRSLAGKPASDALRPGFIRSRSEPEIAEAARNSRRNAADLGKASAGSNRLSTTRSAAVAGMNCAMPWARAPLRIIGPSASARRRLSCQITRANR